MFLSTKVPSTDPSLTWRDKEDLWPQVSQDTPAGTPGQRAILLPSQVWIPWYLFAGGPNGEWGPKQFMGLSGQGRLGPGSLAWFPCWGTLKTPAPLAVAGGPPKLQGGAISLSLHCLQIHAGAGVWKELSCPLVAKLPQVDAAGSWRER